MVRVFLRFVGGLLGLAAAMIAIVIPPFAYFNVAVESGWREQHPASVLGGIVYWFLTLVATGLCSAMAFAFIRYSMAGPKEPIAPQPNG